MNLLSLSCPKQKATLWYSLILRQSELSEKFVVSKYYHSVPEAEYQGGYGNGEYFSDLADAIVEFREQAEKILDRYRSYPGITEVKPGSILGSSSLFEFKMEALVGISYRHIYLVDMNGLAGDRPLHFFVISTEMDSFSLDGWEQAIVIFSNEINNCLSRVALNLTKGEHQ